MRQKTLLLMLGLVWAWAGNLEARVYRIATMVPDKTSYSILLEEFSKKVAEATEKRVEFKFFWGGVQGDEAGVLRKIHGGTLHGGVFTAQAISIAFPDFRVLEVPFTFENREQSSKVLNELRPYLVEGLSKANFQTLGVYETGEIYFVTKKETPNINALKGQKIWLIDGDKLAESFIKNMDLVATAVSLPEVLTSLSTNLIDAAYAPAIAILALQWHTRVSYLVEPPFGYHFQGFLMGNSSWKTIAEKDRKAIETLVTEYEKKISTSNLAEANNALEAIKATGVKILKWPDSDVKEFKAIRNKVLEELTGPVLSKEVTSQVNKKL